MKFYIFCLILFAIENMKLFIVTFPMFNNKMHKSKSLISNFGIIIVLCIILLILQKTGMEDYATYPVGFFAIFNCCDFLGNKRKIPEVFVYYIGICVLDMLIAGIFVMFTDLDINYFLDESVGRLFFDFFSVFIYIAFIAIYKNIKWAEFKSKYLMLIIVIGLLTNGTYIAAIQIYDELNGDKIKSVYTFIITIISGVTFLIIAFNLLVSRQLNNKYREMYAITKNIVEQQSKYYRKLLERDIETKKFRHDINNHLYYMHYLSDSQKYNTLHSYISNLSKEVEALKNLFDTGNELVDVISNDILNDVLDKIKVKWIGYLPEKMSMSDIDLTSLFANILKNAVEAVQEMNEDEEAEILVEIKEVSSNILINVKNTYNKEKIKNFKGRFYTSKKDKQNHGFGNIIVENIVLKYNGRISKSQNDKYYQIEILLLDVF